MNCGREPMLLETCAFKELVRADACHTTSQVGEDELCIATRRSCATAETCKLKLQYGKISQWRSNGLETTKAKDST